MVKEELNSEEKLFEQAVIVEKYLKKYKKQLIAGVVAIAVLVGANIIYDSTEASRVTDANKALNTLLADANNTEAQKNLKTLAPRLYAAWAYSNAMSKGDLKALEELSRSDLSVVADLSFYELASQSKDMGKLADYSKKDEALFKDLAIVQQAILLMRAGDTKKAHTELQKIATESPLHNVANSLMHYGVN